MAMFTSVGHLLGFGSRTRPPYFLSTRSSTWFITATVMTAVFTDIFLYAVIVPVFPFSLVERIGVEPSSIQYWLSILLSAYGAALLVSAPIFGILSDRIESRRGPMLTGMIVLAGSTVMLCLARNLPLLIVGRVVQGASAGVVWVVGLALLADTVGKQHAGQAMGYVAMAYSLAALLAPLLGGIVYEKSGYYAVFAMTFGMIALDVALRLAMIEKKVAKRWSQVPAVDVHLPARDQDLSMPVQDEEGRVSTAAAPLQDAAPNNKPDSSTAEATNTLSSSLVVKRLPPMLILLKSRRMQATFWACTIDALILTAFDTTLPLFVEDTFHWSSLGAGLIFLAPLIPAFVQPLYGWWIDHHGPRWPAALGLVICIPPLVCLRFVTDNTIGQKVLLCALLAIIGVGIALTLAAVMAEFTYIAAEKELKQPGSMGKGGAYAQSYSFFNIAWSLGSLVGAYWAGGIRESAGWGTMGWSLALLCGVGTVPTVIYVGGNVFDARKQKRAQPTVQVDADEATS